MFKSAVNLLCCCHLHNKVDAKGVLSTSRGGSGISLAWEPSKVCPESHLIAFDKDKEWKWQWVVFINMTSLVNLLNHYCIICPTQTVQTVSRTERNCPIANTTLALWSPLHRQYANTKIDKNFCDVNDRQVTKALMSSNYCNHITSFNNKVNIVLVY